MTTSELDVSPLVMVIDSELSKLMYKFFNVVHEKHDVLIEDLKNAWQEITETEIKIEEPKKPKTRVAKKPTDVATCIATIANGSRKNEICGVKVGEKSESGKYCNRHVTWEKKEKKKTIKLGGEVKIEDKLSVEMKEPSRDAVPEDKLSVEMKEPSRDAVPEDKLSEPSRDAVPEDKLSEPSRDAVEMKIKIDQSAEEEPDELKEVIRTVLDIQRLAVA